MATRKRFGCENIFSSKLIKWSLDSTAMRLTYVSCLICLLLLLHIGGNARASQINLALGKPTGQKNDFLDMNSSLAVDGSLELVRPHCAHTRPATSPWWFVDLQAEYDIGWVRIYNRVDCCSERLSNFTISVGDDNDSDGNVEYTPCYYHDGEYGIEPIFLPCNATQPARYVKIQLTAKDALTLCEVEIYSQYPTLDVTSRLPSLGDVTETGTSLQVSTTVDITDERSTLRDNKALEVYSTSPFYLTHDHLNILSTSFSEEITVPSEPYVSSGDYLNRRSLDSQRFYRHSESGFDLSNNILTSSAYNSDFAFFTIMGSLSDTSKIDQDETSPASTFDTVLGLTPSSDVKNSLSSDTVQCSSSPSESSESLLDVHRYSSISPDVMYMNLETSFLDTEVIYARDTIQAESVLSETSKPTSKFHYSDADTSLMKQVSFTVPQSSFMASTSAVALSIQVASFTTPGNINEQEFTSSAIYEQQSMSSAIYEQRSLSSVIYEQQSLSSVIYEQRSMSSAGFRVHSDAGGTVLYPSDATSLAGVYLTDGEYGQSSVSFVPFEARNVQYVCICRCKRCVPTDVSMAEEEAQELRENLLLDRRNLSQYIRTKISAENKVPSSWYIGWFGVTLFGLLFAVVFIPDVVTVTKCLLTKRQKDLQNR